MLTTFTRRGLMETFLTLQIQNFIRNNPKEKELELELDPEDITVIKDLIALDETYRNPFEVTVGKRKRRVRVTVPFPFQNKLLISLQRMA